MPYDTSFKVGERVISGNSPTYFIADIGANHDGRLDRAKELIRLAKDSGADCAKFQHFQADKIVSKEGFKDLKITHQAKWPKSVYETCEDYSINRDWNEELAATCKEVGIDFMTTPYDLDAAFDLWKIMHQFKIGSGDITYISHIEALAKLQQPIFLATGASSMPEVERAVEAVLQHNPRLCLMQCNTNYTGDMNNFSYVNLNVLKTFARYWPGMPLGLSDHTPGYTAVLGAVALGATVIEKHFTDDPKRDGPDHAFALHPGMWKAMVLHTRDLEKAMGDGVKICEDNEVESRIVQRRAIRCKRDLVKGSVVAPSDVEFLRPCPEGAFTPAQIDNVVGGTVRRDLHAGDAITRYDIY